MSHLLIPYWLVYIVVAIFAYLMFPELQRIFFAAKSLAISGPLKQVFLVRMDLKMGSGKIAAQCSHAAVKAFKEMSRSESGKRLTEAWETTGHTKVVLKVADEEAILDLAEQAKKLGINVATIRDAGRTQIAAGSLTVVALGPGSAEAIDQVTGNLKLL